MKKSYHSIVVPMVEAMTALRHCLLWSETANVECTVMVVAIALF